MRTTTLLLSTTLMMVTLSGAALGAGAACEPQTEVLRENGSLNGLEQYFVVDNRTEWCQFWGTAFGTPCDLSLVDFDSEVAVIAVLGVRDSTCYRVDIECIERIGNSPNVRIRVVETQRKTGCICGQQVIRPVTVVVTPRPVHRTGFEKRIDTVCCEPDPLDCRQFDPL